MKSTSILLGLLLAGCAGAPARSSATAGVETSSRPALAYPDSPRGDTVDEYHGTQVADPYRWLEEHDSEATAEWVAAQNEVTFGYLEALPARTQLIDRLTELWNYERFSAPRKRGASYFYTRNDGLQDQSVLYVTSSLDAPGRVLLDPNKLSSDGTMALAGTAPSPDGTLLAYAISDGGSDWRTWRFRDVASGEDLPDVITRNKFGGLDWLAGGESVVYTRYVRSTEGDDLVAKNLPAEIALHRLGTDEAQDVVLRERPQEGYSIWVGVNEARDGIFISTVRMQDRHAAVDHVTLEGGRPVRTTTLTGDYEAQYQVFADDGTNAFVQTNADAPNWRVLAMPLDGSPASELIAETGQSIENASTAGGHIALTYLEHATSRVKVFSTSGEHVRDVELPGIGTVRGFGGDYSDPECFFSFTTHTRPSEIWRHDIGTGESSLFRRPEAAFDPSQFEARQVFYASADGTKVPMFIAHKKGLELDGRNRTYLYGYGGFNISLTPGFSVANLVWMEQGGVLAIPNLRGGGEYGEAWHVAGTKLDKQNVFDDFIAAAEWLIDEGYTSSASLAIGGGSNGGLLVGACMTQRPDLFAACLPAVGVMDMLRYHHFTIGWAWAGDYGTVDDEDEFRALRAYSPLHNLEHGTAYPATMVTTADRDDRVVPCHSFKFAAALQAAHAGSDPVLIRIETRAGHGAGKPTAMRIEEAADRLAFMLANLEGS